MQFQDPKEDMSTRFTSNIQDLFNVEEPANIKEIKVQKSWMTLVDLGLIVSGIFLLS